MGLFLKSPWGDIVAYSICYEFKAINNEAGYEALFFGLKASEDLKINNIDINCDSLLIVNHINGTYEANDHKMMTYLNIVKGLQREFENFTIQQVSRDFNT